MLKRILPLTLSACLGAAAAPAALAQSPITEQEAHAIAVDAYVYFYPLLSMEITRRQFTNVAPGKEMAKGPMNLFSNVPEYPPADFKGVVRSNFDTLYSSAWLDMSKEPVVISVPDTDGRYYLLPMLDMWTDVFASPGWRTTGTKAGTFLITPPGWRPDLRDRFVEEFKLPKETQRIEAPTPYVWVIGRTKTDGPPDYDAVRKIQAGYKVALLSEYGKAPKPVEFKPDPSVDMKTPPKVQVDTMSAGVYFANAADLLKLHPPHVTDQPIIARMTKIGIEPGKSFDIGKLDPVLQRALETAPQDAQKLMAWKLPTLARVANGWGMNTDTMGVYGNYYLKRAIVAQQGLGANVVEDAIYPLNLADEVRQAARWRQQIHHHLREGRHASGQCVLVNHPLRSRRLPDRQRAEPFCGLQLDAVQIQCGRFARPLFPECEPRQGARSQLASCTEDAVQSDDAPVRAEVGSADRKMESAASREVANNGGHFGTIKIDGTPALLRRRPAAPTRSPPKGRCIAEHGSNVSRDTIGQSAIPGDLAGCGARVPSGRAGGFHCGPDFPSQSYR